MSPTLHPRIDKHSPPVAIRQVIASSLLALWLFALLLSVFPELHHIFHSDSNTAQHQCLVTHLRKGHLDSHGTIATVLRPTLVCFDLPQQPEEVFHQSVDLALLPSRAPPAQPQPTVV